MNTAGASIGKGTFFAALFAMTSFAALAFAFSATLDDFEWGKAQTHKEKKATSIKAKKVALKNNASEDDNSQKVGAAPLDMRRDSERALLNAARSALTQMALGHATAKLAEHKRLYPQGALLKEREALDVWRVSLEGDESRTLAAAEAFLERYEAPSKERSLVEALISTP